MTLQLEANCVIEFDLSLLIALDYLRIIIVLFIIYFARLVFPKALYLYGNSILYHFRVYANAIIKEQDRVNVHRPHLVTFSRCHISIERIGANFFSIKKLNLLLSDIL